MKSITKLVAFAGLAPFLAVVLLVLGLATWGLSNFPSDISAPDSSRVPPVVLEEFAQHLHSNRDWYATRLFLQRDRDQRLRSQLAFTVAALVAEPWVSHWSPVERITEIAQQSYFGHGFRGVESAAQGYFGRSASALSREQVAALALLTRSPSRLSPWCHREVFEREVAQVPSLAAIEVSLMLTRLVPPPEGACPPAAQQAAAADPQQLSAIDLW